VAPTVGLGLGSNASGSTRRMTDGSSNYLTYENVFGRRPYDRVDRLRRRPLCTGAAASKLRGISPCTVVSRAIRMWPLAATAIRLSRP
jgi:hypothetical protein